MRHSRRRSLLLALPLLSLACSSSSSSSSRVCPDEPFDVGGASTPQVVRFNGPYRWVDATYDEVRSDDILFPSAEAPVPDDNLAVRWLQAWTDQIDAMVREQAARDLGAPLLAPKPLVRIVPSSIYQATAAAVHVLVQSPTGNASALFPFRVPTYPGTSAAIASTSSTVAPRSASWNDHAAVATYLQANAQVGAVSVQDGRIKFACARAADGTASGVAVVASAPLVRFTGNLALNLTEGAAVLVLAHELSHYYRAHGTVGLATPTYWFEDASASTWEPVASTRGTQIDRAYRVAIGGTDPSADPELVKQVRANAFSFLTIEMQADRLAAYLLTRLGLDAKAVDAAFADLQEAVGTFDQQAGSCADLTAKGFRDDAGAAVFVPIFRAPDASGDVLPSGHPTLCYRAFDFHRQTGNRAFAMGARPAIAGSWADAQASLEPYRRR